MMANAMTTLIVIIGVLIVAAALLVIMSRKRKAKKIPAVATVESISIDELLGSSEPASARPDTEALRQNLRVKMLHDEAKVDGAIERERKRLPNATLAECMQAAIERWERDNR